MQIRRLTCRAITKPQMVAKRLFHKTFRNIKSFLLKGFLKLPRNPFTNSLFPDNHKVGPRMQETEGEAVNKEQRKGEEQCSKSSMSVTDQSQLEDWKDERKKARKYSGEPSFIATEKFAQKMEELEMMDVNNGDHVMDIEEVIHQYSLLTSPVYLDIVDNFFKDVYLELYLPQPSRNRNGSMRKVGSCSANGSMRKVSSGSVHGSTRKPVSTSVYGSMRKLGLNSVHGSMRNLGPLKL